MIHLNNIDYVVGSENVENKPLKVLDDMVCAFIAELSVEILRSPLIHVYPDLSALAFWGRKANLQKIRNNFGNEKAGRLGRGLCFHIAPSNIPMNFAFSYLFSLLAGNANIVRLPSKIFQQTEVFCSIFKTVVKGYPEIEKRTAFIRYPRNDEITAAFCLRADARMIWGGDRTISLIKSCPASPRCVDIAFADRYSVALINGNAILLADDMQIKRLAENFYNDTYLMDQNACSSPQIILWQNDNEKAREIFWDAVVGQTRKKYMLQDAVAVDKYTKLCEESIGNNNLKMGQRVENLLYRMELKALTTDIVNHRGKGGLFFEYALKNLNELFAVTTEKFQTITYFGVDATVLQNAIIENCLRGIDRIVPIGKAMDIGSIWDGHDLIRELSRIVSVG